MDFTNTWKYHQTENRDHLKNASRRLRFVANEIGRLSDVKKVLDIGFGDGHLLGLLSNKYDVYGIDFVEENVTMTRGSLGLGEHIKFGNILNIPFADNSFDLVTATEILEHLSQDDLLKSLTEVRRILKSNGYLLITVPYNENLQEKMTCCPHCGTTFHVWGHQQSFNDDNLQKKLGEGFHVMTVKKTVPMGETQNFFGWMESFGRRILGKYKGYLIILKSDKV